MGRFEREQWTKMVVSLLNLLVILVVLSLFQAEAVGGNPTKPLLSTSASSEPPIQVSQCPDPLKVAPCICSTSEKGGALACSGPTANQSTVENAIREVRRTNGIPDGRGFQIWAFQLSESLVTQFDMAPFYGSRIEWFSFVTNRNMTKFVTSGDPGDYGSIHVDNFDFQTSRMSREGFGDTLKYFSNEMTIFSAAGFSNSEGGGFSKSSNKSNNNKHKNRGEFEFEILPGLSAHTNLKHLSINNGNLSGQLDLGMWIPKELQNLEQVFLGTNNISEIGPHFFDFALQLGDLVIGLDGNRLSETSIHPDSGITRAGRKTTLHLRRNQITTIPAEVFEPFLNAHPENEIGLYQNPLICDKRISWLKARRVEFEDRVKNAVCANDSRHTVFDSALIP